MTSNAAILHSTGDTFLLFQRRLSHISECGSFKCRVLIMWSVTVSTLEPLEWTFRNLKCPCLKLFTELAWLKGQEVFRLFFFFLGMQSKLTQRQIALCHKSIFKIVFSKTSWHVRKPVQLTSLCKCQSIIKEMSQSLFWGSLQGAQVTQSEVKVTFCQGEDGGWGHEGERWGGRSWEEKRTLTLAPCAQSRGFPLGPEVSARPLNHRVTFVNSRKSRLNPCISSV